MKTASFIVFGLLSAAAALAREERPPATSPANDPTTDFEGDALTGVELYPVDLGAALPRPRGGTPRLAGEALACEIVERMARFSEPYRTTIHYEGGVGLVELEHASN